MIPFERITPDKKAQLDRYLLRFGGRGCEYNFANLYLWGRQNVAEVEGNLAVFSHFSGKSLYLFPIGDADLKKTLDALMADARERGIAFRLTCVSEQERALLEQWYPGKFHFHVNRGSFDYVYDINDLADLKGRRFQKKRNHANRFQEEHPDAAFLPLSEETLPLFRQAFADWFARHQEGDPNADLYMEQVAVKKALESWEALALEGLVLVEDGRPLAATLGSRLCQDTFDVHFEKADPRAEGAYAVINREFTRRLREKHTELRWLNREDDLGVEGLRKAKLSYCPAHLIEKSWAALREDGYEY